MAEDDADWYLDVLHPVISHVSDKADSYGEITDEAEEEILDSGVDALLDELAKKHDVAVQEERQRRRRMDSSIYSTWGHALDFLDFFIVLNQKARNHFETMADVDEKGENYQFDPRWNPRTNKWMIDKSEESLKEAIKKWESKGYEVALADEIKWKVGRDPEH